MSAQDFERFAIGVLTTVYGGRGIQILHTPYGHDEGRDAESSFFLDDELPDDLQVRVRLWIEAKKRSANVGPYAVGRHLFAAFCRDVTKIIFVTNLDFTPNVRKSIQEFCSKASIQFGLVSGRRLLELATQSNGNEACVDRGPSIKLKCVSKAPLALSVVGQLVRSLRAPAAGWTVEIVAPGEPFFLLADVSVSGDGEIGQLAVIDDSTANPKLDIASYGRTPIGPFRDSDNVRLRYSIRAGEPGVVDLRRFSVRANGARSPVFADESNRSLVTIERPLFNSYQFTAQTGQIDAAVSVIESWLKDPVFEFVVLSGAAGLGKTHLVGELRSRWLGGGIEELLLDGADIHNEAALVHALFDYVFPVPPHQLGEARLKTLRNWLRDAGLTADRSRDVARALIDGRVDGNASSHLLADVVHALIVSVSKERPFVVVFEDLHKASYGVIEVIREAIDMLRRHRARCLWLATSRPASVEADFERRESWRSAFDALCAAARRRIDLERPDDDDARHFLAASVRGFAAPMTKRVVEQVGSHPFGLREALLFMKIAGIVEEDEILGTLVLRRPEDLRMRLETEEFKAATDRRLRLLRAGNATWLGRLLDVAGCLGKRFDLALCRRMAGAPAGEAFSSVLEMCRRESVIRPSFTDNRAYQFDHDLVRVTTLRSMAVVDRMEIAEQLLDETTLDLRTRTLLTYLAAHAQQFIDAALAYADERVYHHRYVDAVEVLTLAVLVADPKPYDAVDRRAAAAAFDDAAAEATLPQMEPPMPERRLIDLIWKTLEALAPVTSGSSATEERLITHADLLARKEREWGRQAALLMRRGAMLLERGDPEQAYEAHKEAAALFERLSSDEYQIWYAERRRNAVHMAIACRHTNRNTESHQILTEILATARDDEYNLRADCLADLGALDFYERPNLCRKQWEDALSVYRAHGNAPGEVHMLLDLADLDIADRCDEGAAQKVRRARDLATELGLDNELLRAHVFSAVLALAASDHETAEAHLVDALERGLLRSIGRRLWKIWGNLATAAEAAGNAEEAYVNDDRCLRALPIPALVVERRLELESWPDARVAVALGNIALRARSSDRHRLLLAKQPDVLRTAASRIATAADGVAPSALVGRLSGYLRQVSGKARFLAT